MLQVTLTGGPAGWGIDNTLCRKSAKMPEELTMVVSVTEPKLLIKILHVTFTGGPVKWNDNDMTGKSLKPYHQGRLGLEQWRCFIRKFGSVGSQAAVSLCMSTCINTSRHWLSFFHFILFYRSSRSGWWHAACFVKPDSKDHMRTYVRD